MKKLVPFVLIFLFVFSATAQVDCSNQRYIDKVFEDLEIIDNVIYATKQKSNGDYQDLGYDVYMPAGDTVSLRPAVMLAHGGGYIDFIDQKSPDIVKIAKDLAQRGYVVVSVEYREEASPLALLNEETMVKAVGRALIDIRDATCFLMDTTINYNNPYRVDVDQVIVGGVSAGAVSFLQAIFLDSISWVPDQFREWILEVEPNTQALLNDKYCGATVKGMINISGALLDTAWIREYKKEEYPAMMHVHGGADPIVPYGYDHPFGLTNLPKLMGSELIHERSNILGIRSELDFYPNQGHVPILGFNLDALFSGGDPWDVLFNPYIMNRTLRHIAEFCYSLLDCAPLAIPTALSDAENQLKALYPNPGNGQFSISMSVYFGEQTLTIINQMGQTVMTKNIPSGTSALTIVHDLPAGLYQVLLSDGSREITGRTSLVVMR